MENKPDDKYEKCSPELRLKYEVADILDILVKSVHKTKLTTLSLGTTALAEDIIAKVKKFLEV